MKKVCRLFLFAVIILAWEVSWSADAESSNVSSPLTWAGSPHADAESESFTHWNDDGEIPADCAACHSRSGFLDYIGADGTQAHVTDNAAPTGTVVDCDTCHNDSIKALNSVKFPSGIVVENITSSVQCLICHQGRASTVSVNDSVGTSDDDTVSDGLQFINVHYRAAAATLYGSEVKGGYEYTGREYAGLFAHVPPFNTCSGCHDAHTTLVKVETCSECHRTESLPDIRISEMDFDANGDVNEGISVEITALHLALGTAIQRYSREVAQAPVLYHPERYPYYFNDTDNNGELSDQEAKYPNRYKHWTPRLLKAAYNYQFVAKDPGSYAHNPRYVLQLLFDSLASLGDEVALDDHAFIRPE